MKKKKIIGLCKICKQEKELTYEHIPPKSANNKSTKFYEISTKEYYQNAEDYVNGNMKPKSQKKQGGMGSYCLCENCNAFLGKEYVRDYKQFALIANSIMSEHKNAKGYSFNIAEINLLNFIKQVIAIFICQNCHSFTLTYEGLIEFVTDTKSQYLPDKYKLYMYLNDEGNFRNGHVMYTNKWGTICEFTFRPFGFVLSIDNPFPIIELSNVTDFKNYNPDFHYKQIPIILNKYPAILPFPLDFRTKEEIFNS